MVYTMVFLMGKSPLVNTKSQILMNFLDLAAPIRMLNFSIKMIILFCHLLKTLKRFNFLEIFEKIIIKNG